MGGLVEEEETDIQIWRDCLMQVEMQRRLRLIVSHRCSTEIILVWLQNQPSVQP